MRWTQWSCITFLSLRVMGIDVITLQNMYLSFLKNVLLWKYSNIYKSNKNTIFPWIYYPALAMIWLVASLISSLHLFLSLTQDYFLRLIPDIISFNCYCKFQYLVGVSKRSLNQEEHVKRLLSKGIGLVAFVRA